MRNSNMPVLTVLLSMPGPNGTTRFVDQLVRHPGEITHLYFSWRTALFGAYDVLHVHWPESLVRSRSAVVRAVKSVATVLLLLRLWASHKPVVRTVHNTTPHAQGDRLERLLLAWLDGRVSAYICLNEVTVTRPGISRFLVPHGSYHEPFYDHPRNPSASGLLFFGRLEEYKGIDQLLSAFEKIVDESARLRLVGQVSGDANTLVAAAERDPRISVDLRFVSDAELVWEVSSAELVVLPYRHMENSGALFVALSLGRPVLAPWSPVNAVLREEFGPSWLMLYQDSLDSHALSSALSAARGSRSTPPKMTGRSWPEVGKAHEQVYISVCGSRPVRPRAARSSQPDGEGGRTS